MFYNPNQKQVASAAQVGWTKALNFLPGAQVKHRGIDRIPSGHRPGLMEKGAVRSEIDRFPMGLPNKEWAVKIYPVHPTGKCYKPPGLCQQSKPQDLS